MMTPSEPLGAPRPIIPNRGVIVAACGECIVCCGLEKPGTACETLAGAGVLATLPNDCGLLVEYDGVPGTAVGVDVGC